MQKFVRGVIFIFGILQTLLYGQILLEGELYGKPFPVFEQDWLNTMLGLFFLLTGISGFVVASLLVLGELTGRKIPAAILLASAGVPILLELHKGGPDLTLRVALSLLLAALFTTGIATAWNAIVFRVRPSEHSLA